MFWPETLKDWIEVAAALAILVGGGWGLYTYLKVQKIQATDILLRMEIEFREVLPTYELLEDGDKYRDSIVPLITTAPGEGVSPSAKNLEELEKLDRCLRFLFLCTILERTVLIRAYYYYLSILILPEREELRRYLDRYYRMLSRWIEKNQGRLCVYRESGRWGWWRW